MSSHRPPHTVMTDSHGWTPRRHDWFQNITKERAKLDCPATFVQTNPRPRREIKRQKSFFRSQCQNGFLNDCLGNRCVRTMIGAVVFLTLTCSASFVPAESPPAEELPVSLTLLRQEASRLLTAQATANSAEQKSRTVEALCDLYVAMRADERYGESEMMQQDAAKIRRRLLNIARANKSTLRRKKVAKPDRLSETIDRTIADALAKKKDHEPVKGDASDSRSDSSSSGSSSSGSSSSGDFQLASKSAAAPAGFAPGMMDDGWQLVELIERTVQPDFWDKQGGPGSIGYFAMRRVLVVRATSDVHQQIKVLLRKLPR